MAVRGTAEVSGARSVRDATTTGQRAEQWFCGAATYVPELAGSSHSYAAVIREAIDAG